MSVHSANQFLVTKTRNNEHQGRLRNMQVSNIMHKNCLYEIAPFII